MRRKSNSWIRDAVKRGYTVDQFGVVIGPLRKPLQLMLRKGRNTPYLCFTINDRKVKVHRFVAFLKFGARALRAKIVVRHQDNNNFNNSWDNILLGTQSQNERDKPAETHQRSGARLLASRASRRILVDAR